MAETHRGSCFCGAIEIVVSGEPLEMGYCHCSSCRSYSGEAVSSYILWKSDSVSVTRGAEHLGRFNKSGMSERQFCKRCGGHMMTYHPDLGLTDMRRALIPSVPFRPLVHLNYAETISPMRDGLPKLRDFPAAAGGSGVEISE
jgi:hypothetical protein